MLQSIKKSPCMSESVCKFVLFGKLLLGALAVKLSHREVNFGSHLDAADLMIHYISLIFSLSYVAIPASKACCGVGI